jgi:hypothetical protein
MNGVLYLLKAGLKSTPDLMIRHTYTNDKVISSLEVF